MFTVSEIMSRDLVSLSESEPLGTAEEYLDLGHIRHLPVVRGRKLVGLVTHRDLLRACGGSVDARARVAQEVMTRDVVTVRPDSAVREAIRLMLTNKFGCLPVTTADGTLVGIVTESDLLKFAAERAADIDRREAAAEYSH